MRSSISSFLLVVIITLLGLSVVDCFSPSSTSVLEPLNHSPLNRLQHEITSSSDSKNLDSIQGDGKDEKTKFGKKFLTSVVATMNNAPVQAAGVTGTPAYTCEIESLHPTQIAVGYEAMNKKRDTIQSKQKKGIYHDYLKEKPIPVIIGPNGQSYLIDHHHLSRALYEEKIKYGLCTSLGDWSKKSIPTFWKDMAAKKWVFMNDENGLPITFTQIPDHIGKLVDNPYRSVAGFVRENFGYIRTSTPFAEFYWADYFRKYITLNEIKKDFKGAVKKAMELAKKPEAANLPGYSALPIPKV